MILFKKETFLLLIAVVVAILGLIQLSHEQAYATIACQNCPCAEGIDGCLLCPESTQQCVCNGEFTTTCGYYSTHCGCGGSDE